MLSSGKGRKEVVTIPNFQSLVPILARIVIYNRSPVQVTHIKISQSLVQACQQCCQLVILMKLHLTVACMNWLHEVLHVVFGTAKFLEIFETITGSDSNSSGLSFTS